MEDLIDEIFPSYQEPTITSRFSLELQEAYQRAFDRQITTKKSIESADMTGTLIRSHAAKMISQFAMNVLGKNPDLSRRCAFSDIQDQSLEMQYYIELSCELWLMWLQSDGMPSNIFNPWDTVTRAQFGTMLSRLLYGSTYNTLETENWYVYHLQALKKVDIMKKIDTPFDPEQRWFVMLMMKRSVK